MAAGLLVEAMISSQSPSKLHESMLSLVRAELIYPRKTKHWEANRRPAESDVWHGQGIGEVGMA